MLKIEGKDIYMTRNNSAVIEFDFFRAGEKTELQETEHAFFTLRKTFDSDIIWQKEVKDNKITLTSSDTQLESGSYVYDMTVLDGTQITTIVPYHRLCIVDEVY